MPQAITIKCFRTWKETASSNVIIWVRMDNNKRNGLYLYDDKDKFHYGIAWIWNRIGKVHNTLILLGIYRYNRKTLQKWCMMVLFSWAQRIIPNGKCNMVKRYCSTLVGHNLHKKGLHSLLSEKCFSEAKLNFHWIEQGMNQRTFFFIANKG